MSTPRGFLPDAVDASRLILLKACDYLRLTYEIKLAAFMAQKEGSRLELRCIKHCRFSPELQTFLDRLASVIQVVRS